MTHIPKLALATAFVAGLGGLTLAVPAIAKDKAPAADPNALKPSPAVIKVAKPAQDALQAKNVAAAEPAVAAVEAAATTVDDKYIAAVLRVQLEGLKLSAAQAAGQPVNDASLKAPLEALVASPKTPADKKAEYAYQRGLIAFNEHNNKEALSWLGQAQQLGHRDANMSLMIVQAKIDSGDVAGGTADLDAAIQAMTAAGQKAPESYYKYALSASYKKGDKPATLAWLKRWVGAYPTAKNWRDALTVFGLSQPPLAVLDRNQLIDLFRLMRQTKALPDQAGYLEYAQKVLDAGLPDEARTVITEGRASGKVPAAGGAGAEILTSATRGISSEGSLSALDARAQSAPTGALAQQTADGYFGQGNYTKAIPLYRVALQKGGVKADEVNTHLGIALALSGDKAGAKTAFGAVTSAPRADLASLWVLWIDAPAVA